MRTLNGEHINHIDTKNFAIDAGLIKKLMFDSELNSMVDFDLYLRLKRLAKIQYLANVKVGHYHKRSMKEVVELNFRRGFWTKKIYDKYKGINEPMTESVSIYNFITFPFWMLLQFIKKPLGEAYFLLVSEVSWRAGILWDCFMIYKICRYLGYTIMNNPKRKFDLAVFWEDAPFRDSIFLNQISRNKKVINIGSKDILKEKIDSEFEKVFGYSIKIDPLEYKGECLEKNNLNGLRDGKIINCPLKDKKEGYVYQKIINNIKNDFAEDIRVPIINAKIPLIYLKYKPIKERFGLTYKSRLADIEKHLSDEEISKIAMFCSKIGLDYGELDVLRNKDDGKIYIVDVNNTPTGPPSYISLQEGRMALKILAKTFEKEFFKHLRS
ncbi:MAG: hypothetical protein NTW46_03115 [Candidatus Nealsonbacteria bacterium]|nr:hypothetical protein [Candidatus Nealsonbacteria bacterium]